MNSSVLQAGGLPFVLRSVSRRWVPVTACTVLLSAAATLGILILPERWTASAHLVIETGEARIIDIQGVIPQSPVDTEALASEMEILRSHDIARQAVERVGVERLLPPALPEQEPETPSLLADMSLMVRQAITDLRGPRPTPPEVSDLDRATVRVLRGLDIEAVGRSRVIALHYTDKDPALARDVAAAIADAYLERREDRHSSASEKARVRVQEEIHRIRRELAAAEQNVERFRADHHLLRGTTGSLLAQGATGSVTERLAQARATHFETAAHAHRLRELVRMPGSARAIPQVLDDPVMQALREREAGLRAEIARLAPSYRADSAMVANLNAQLAQLQAELGAELGRAAAAAEARAALTAAQVQSLETLARSTNDTLAEANQREVDLKVLEREAEAARNLLTALLRREQELSARLSLDVASDAYLLSAVAAPTEPSFPKTIPMTALAVLASALLSVALVVVRDLTDQTLRSAEEIEALVPYRTVGLIPRFERSRKNREVAVDALDRDRFAESVKHVFIQMTPHDQPEPKTILVTSGLPGDGKTTMAASLGVVANTLGRRVVVIDIDARRPALHRLFKLPLGPGLLEYMRGEAPLADIVRPVSDRLSIITAGTGDNLTDLLNVERLRTLIAELARDHDHVVIDTPPTLAVAEASALAPFVDQVLHLVRWGVTRRSTLLASTARHRRVDPERMGIVLYQVDVRRHSALGYTDSALYHKTLKRYYLG